MKQLLRLLVVVCALLPVSVFPAAAQPGTPAGLAPSPTLPGAAVFKLRPGGSLSQVEAALSQLAASHIEQKFPRAAPPSPEKPGSVELRTIYQFRYPAHLTFSKVRQVLLGTGAVEYVEPLYQRAPLYQPNDPLADSTNAGGQYYLKKIQAYTGWDLSKGDSTVVIGITDTGTRFTHQDLRGQEKRNYADPIDGIDNDNDGYVDNFRGWDTADRDNDPSATAPYGGHGVLVAGSAVARPDNGKGLAGVGFNCRYLPLKIYPSTASGAFAGFEAIVYAADHGCKIINASWGGVGGKSQFEQDVISYATLNRDALVVVAAGNANAELDFYPASYDHALSVAGVSPTDRQVLTYSYRVDLSAPGDLIQTTLWDHDSAYVAVGGSSFACPIVAGAAGLVRSKYPQLTAAQVAAVLRQTTDDIYSVGNNAAVAGRLGTGRLNVRRALAQGPNQVAVHIESRQLSRPQLLPADTARLVLRVRNLLQPVQGLTLTVTSLSPGLVVTSGSLALGSLATNAPAIAPVGLRVAATAMPNSRAVLRCRFTAATGFQYDQYLTLELNPDYVTLTASDLHLTVTSRGNLGYEGLNSEIGAGVTFRNSPVLLSEGGLLVATSAMRVSDRLRSMPIGRSAEAFSSLRPIRLLPLASADQQAGGTFQDSLPSLTQNRSVGVRVRQRALAWATPADRDFAIVEYTLRNMTADTLRPLHTGLFMDWDLPADAGRNMAAWDDTRSLGYVTGRLQPTLFAGVKLLTAGRPASYYAINNGAGATAPVSFSNGFSDAEKFLTLSNGTTQRSAGGSNGADVSHVVGVVISKLAPGDSVAVAFAILGGASLAELQAAADAAQIRYAQVLPNRPGQTLAAAWQVYPNPATGRVQVAVPAALAPQQLRLLDLTGRLLAEWTWPARQDKLIVQLPNLGNGVYLLQVQHSKGLSTQRLVVQQQR